MKTFKDLQFETHPADPSGTKARINFDNGYGVSVITSRMFYTDNEHPYEVAILFGNKIDYSTPISDDVIGHQTEEDVTNIMKQVQELPKKEEEENGI